jgi:membrane-associated protein
MAGWLIDHLETWSSSWGPWFYVFLFVLIFAETGLVVTPFLPGDSVLLAVGALASRPGSGVDLVTAMLVLSAAAVLGDSTNYWVGHWLGPKVFQSDTSRILNRRHLERTQAFYARHGGKTIVVCRFLAVIRTFAPFVAGVGRMDYRRFVGFSVLGTVLWVGLFVPLGFWLGNEYADKVDYVVWGIVAFAVVPPTISWLRDRRARAREAASRGGDRGSSR